MDLPFIACSCRKVFNQAKYDLRDDERIKIQMRVRELIDRGYTEREAMAFLYENDLEMSALMDRLGLRKACCRLTFQQMIVIPFPESVDVIATRIKKAIPELANSDLPNEVIANFNRNLIPPIRESAPSEGEPVPSESPSSCSTTPTNKLTIGKKPLQLGFKYVGAGKYAQVILNREYLAR